MLDGLESQESPRRRRQRRISWAFEAPEGAYGAIPVWMSGEAWFDALMDHLASPDGESRRAAARVSTATLLQVARAEWLSADKLTGRGVSTSHETVARKLNVSTKTVKRARDLLVALGFAVVVVQGRHLRSDERAHARATHGRYQNRAASLRALTVPRPVEIDPNVTPPRSGAVKEISPVLDLNQRASARSERPEHPSHPQQGINRPRNPAQKPPGRPEAAKRRQRTYQPWPEAEYRFAAQLRDRLPSLRKYHPTTICQLLKRSHVDSNRWTVSSLLDAIALSSQARGGIPFAAAGKQRNPLGYLGQVLRNSIDPLAETPVEASARRRQVQLDEQFARRREAEVLRARIKAEIEASTRTSSTNGRTSQRPMAAVGVRTIPEAIVGRDVKLYNLPVPTQVLVGDLTNLHRAMTEHGWELEAANAGSRSVTWCRHSPADDETSRLTLTVSDLGDHPLTAITVEPITLDQLSSIGAIPTNTLQSLISH